MAMIGRATRREMITDNASPIRAASTPMPRMILADEIAAASATPAGWLAVTIQFRP